jgi:hypothetical protein
MYISVPESIIFAKQTPSVIISDMEMNSYT